MGAGRIITWGRARGLPGDHGGDMTSMLPGIEGCVSSGPGTAGTSRPKLGPKPVQAVEADANHLIRSCDEVLRVPMTELHKWDVPGC